MHIQIIRSYLEYFLLLTECHCFLWKAIRHSTARFHLYKDQFAFMPAEGKRGTSLFFYPTRSPEPYSRHDTTGLQHLAFTKRTSLSMASLHSLNSATSAMRM